MTWQPNPNPKAPDFEPGNELALKHGGFSPRKRAEMVDELSPAFHEWIADHAPWAAAEEFEPARANYLRHLAVVELLFADVAETAAEHGTAKVPTRRFETLLSALRGELAALGQLGLTPPTKAQLAQTVAVTQHSLADLAEQGRQTRGYKAMVAAQAADASGVTEGDAEDDGD